MRKGPVPEKKKCENCGRPFVATKRPEFLTAKKYLPRFDYCSGSCLRELVKKHGVQYKTKRSKPEIFLESLVRKAFPSLKIVSSDRDTLRSGLELDLHFPGKKVAVEVNGPTHYEPIYGKKSLNRTQRNDANKAAECKVKGIRLLVLDISQVTEKAMESFLTHWFEEVLRPALEDGR